MIQFDQQVFCLTTSNTSYWFGIDEVGHLAHYYYGPLCKWHAGLQIVPSYATPVGTSEIIDEAHPTYFAAQRQFEFSTVGKGDHREAMVLVTHQQGRFDHDFRYVSHELFEGDAHPVGLPDAYGADQTLIITLKYLDLTLELTYSVFEASDVITRGARFINTSNHLVTLQRMFSYLLDLDAKMDEVLTFDGSWISERELHRQSLTSATVKIDSKTGNSSNQHNPFFIVKNHHTTQHQGRCYGFNLIYSGNHCAYLEPDFHGALRITQGINDFGFAFTLNPGEDFVAPRGVMTCTNQGLNQLSQQLHYFINQHIVRGEWQNKPRPILCNNWEGTYFDFNQAKILKMAKAAASCGVELFVLDDGWFKNRNNDQQALGDWVVDTKKLPQGLGKLVKQINQLGMDFGLWFEPEMISVNSDLYRQHSDWAVQLPEGNPALGRNQLVLDLTKTEVVEYLVEQVSMILDSANITYVKWDMNRNITDIFSSGLANQQEFYHRYILGLYHLLQQLTTRFPKILFEGCASGGNRFDLGMLCYFPQQWTSDNTDAISRLMIQGGTSYGYPPSVMGCHVSGVPNHQTLRITPLESRFHVAAFGVLGYELDFTKLNQVDRKTIIQQISDYKQYRLTLQFGRFYRVSEIGDDTMQWMSINTDQTAAYLGWFIHQAPANARHDILYPVGLNHDWLYQVTNRQQLMSIRPFGDLIRHAMPINLDVNGAVYNAIANRVTLNGEVMNQQAYGDALMQHGVKLPQAFNGGGYTSGVRIMGDYGSRLYIFKKCE